MDQEPLVSSCPENLYRLTFGKYQGLTLSEVDFKYPGYIPWLRKSNAAESQLPLREALAVHDASTVQKSSSAPSRIPSAPAAAIKRENGSQKQDINLTLESSLPATQGGYYCAVDQSKTEYILTARKDTGQKLSQKHDERMEDAWAGMGFGACLG